jgi:hypothetical protein
MTRFLASLVSVALVMALTGCAFFGTHEGFEEGDAPRWNVSGMTSFSMVGIAPANADAGDTVTVFLASELDAPTNAFSVDDFWFCTFDGEAAMLETGGDDYDSAVDTQVVIDSVEDVEINTDDIDDSVISTVTFTVPEGTVTGEGFIITPSSEMEWFLLGIQ